MPGREFLSRPGIQSSASGGFDRDAARLHLGRLRDRDLEDAVRAASRDGLGVNRLRQRETPQETARGALDALHAGVLVARDRVALARDTQGAGVHRDVDVVGVHAGNVRAQYEAALFLDDMTKKLDKELSAVVHIQVPDDIVVKRLLQRGRKDDTEEVIRRRLEIFSKDTTPIISHYGDQTLLVRVDGIGTIDEVQDRIRQGLKEHSARAKPCCKGS